MKIKSSVRELTTQLSLELIEGAQWIPCSSHLPRTVQLIAKNASYLYAFRHLSRMTLRILMEI